MNVLELIREKRTYLSNIVRRDANWVGHYLRRNCSLRDTIEGNMGEVKGMERRRTIILSLNKFDENNIFKMKM